MGVEKLLPANGSEAGSSKTTPPYHKIHLATRRISQFVFGRLPLLGLTVLSLFSDSPPAFSQKVNNNSSNSGENTLINPDTPPSEKAYQSLTAYPHVETNKEPLLTAAEVFGNNVTTESELRKTPNDIRDFKLVTNPQDNVSEIITIKNTRKGKFVYRIMLDPQKGTFRDAFQATRTPLSMEAESIVKVGRMIGVGGQTEWSSDIPVLLRSIDSVRPFESTNLSNINLSRVAEMYQIPNAPSKVMLVSGANSAILDTESLKTVQTLSRSGSGVVVTATPDNNQTAEVYSLVSNGLLRELINLSTGQVFENQLYFNGVYVDGYDFKKDASGKPTHILVTDEANQRDLVLELATNIIKSTSYQDLLDKIPVRRKDMLLLRSVSIVNDWIWEAGQFSSGDGSGGVVVFARPFRTDPNINSKDVAVYVIIKELSGMHGGILQQGFKRGIFGGLAGHLLNIVEYGLVFIPSNQDGSPIAGATPTHIGIKDNPPPTVNIPVVLDALR